jgi:transposase-like protein
MKCPDCPESEAPEMKQVTKEGITVYRCDKCGKVYSDK